MPLKNGQPTGPRVVIVGGGFGGLYTAKALKRAPASVILVDRTNHHLFQPLLYQVATAGLAPEQIAVPIRAVLRGQRNAEVALAEVTAVSPEKRLVYTDAGVFPYDILVLATGARHSYFGHPEWERIAPGLKEIGDALEVRQRIITAFEMAELEADPVARQAWLTFVLVGGGPTGVEMAGQIAEMARFTLVRDFRHIHPRSARIVLLEAGPHILPYFPPSLSAAAQHYLLHNGVQVRTKAKVMEVHPDGVVLEEGNERISARTVLWTAGNIASPAALWVGAETDRAGRALVAPDLTVPGHPEIFVIGDAAHLEQDGQLVPAVAPAAIQMGVYVARVITAHIMGRSAPPPFRYFDKGNLATVGRHFAVLAIEKKQQGGLLGSLRLKGLLAWLLWLGIHIFYLIGFANRLLVIFQWAWAYVTYGRGARLLLRRRLVATQESPAEAATHPNPTSKKRMSL